MKARGSGDSEVLVVGAGPVGLCAALALAAHGIRTLVLEAGPSRVAPEWRGSTLHPPTLEILDDLGLATGALRGGVRAAVIQYRDLVLDDYVEMPFAAIADRTRFPFRLQYEQYKLLSELRSAASDSPDVEVRYESSVIAADPGDSDTAATVRVRPVDGEVIELSARWLIAADGSHSAVRGSLGVAMVGDTYPTLSLVVATDMPFDEVQPGLGPVSYWTGPTGRMSLIRTPDTWRVALSTDEPADGGDSTEAEVDDDRSVHPRFVEAMSHLDWNRSWDRSDVRQHQMYRSHQRIAGRFRVGRAVLIGDAAHLSATTGGMGLNAGIHDAADLVRRFAGAAGSRRAEQAAVDAYASSRRRVAAAVVQPTTRATRVDADLTDDAARRDRLADLRAIADDPSRLADHLARACMLDAVER